MNTELIAALIRDNENVKVLFDLERDAEQTLGEQIIIKPVGHSTHIIFGTADNTVGFTQIDDYGKIYAWGGSSLDGETATAGEIAEYIVNVTNKLYA